MHARTTTDITLDELLEQKSRLLRVMTSGVLEVEQPVLGRTQYRNFDEMEAALSQLDRLIASKGGEGSDPMADHRIRRPVYPVVTET